jgi:GxxExxY protein
MELINQISGQIIGAAFKVHSQLGPGLLESAYKECLFYELQKLKIVVQKECPLPLVYENVKMAIGYRVDLLVDQKIIVEVKAIEQLTDVHTAQVLTYLKLSKCKIGLLLNFNVADMKKGIRRLIL